MKEPQLPEEEQARLAALHNLQVLDTGPEDRFDRLTRLARHVAGTPIALVSLIDANRQWFKSRSGLDASETPRDVSFCGHAILQDDIFLIEDSHLDPRFADNPLVTSPPHVRFYAGIPLRLSTGFRVGTLCVIDHVPRQLSGEQITRLRDLADAVVAELERNQVADLARRLQQKSERLRSILETIVDGVITIDELGTIRSVNTATERMFGFPSEEMVGQNVKMLMPEPYHSAHDGYLANYRASHQPRIIGIGREVTAQRKDGSRFPLYLAVGEMKISGETKFTGIVRDISREVAAREKLGDLLDFQQTILDSADASIISTDENGVIRSINRAGQSMLGYSADELVGETSPAIIHVASEVVARATTLSEELGTTIEPGFEVFVAKVRRGLRDKNEWTYVRKDGTTFPVELSVSALHNAEGGLKGFLGIATDISARREAEQAKNEFISTVSHELRTPLTSIRGALGLVLARFVEGIPEKALKLLDTANRNSERLTLLINDILDLEKIEAGKMDFNLAAADLADITRRALEANGGYAAQHGVSLRATALPPTAAVQADEHRLQQVFSNLLSNAVKYSPPQGIVEVSVTETGHAWRVSVQDYGRGIPAQFHSRIFQRFSQADSSDAREKGGTGLGLTISRAIIERHGGEIGFTSREGEGPSFFFTVPKSSPVSTPKPDDLRPRVLICERNPDVGAILGRLLDQQGIASDLTGSLGETISRLEDPRYRALLVDIGAGEQSSFEIIRGLRVRESTRALPIIVLSTRARGETDIRELAGLSVHQWLQKPVDRQQLLDALVNARSARERPRLLHIEDDLDVIQIAQGITEGEADYEYATTLADARRCLASGHYDLLLLDLNLPDGDGRELIELAGPTTRVIVFSGEPAEISREAAVAATLVKSQVSNEKLLATIRRVLGPG